MTEKELTDVLGAKPEKTEKVAARVGFKKEELLKTLLSMGSLINAIVPAIREGKSFRVELRCGTEAECAEAFVYMANECDAGCTSREC